MTDEEGRVRILHGVNLVTKVQGGTPLDAGFSRDDVRLLRDNGFNTVRLGINWTSLEPRPGAFDRAYLDEIASVYRLLADAGVLVLLDMHQDMWGPKYEGFGHPEWSNLDDGLPAEPKAGFPINYFTMPALWRAFESLWKNRAPGDGVGLQDHYARVWRAVAARFAGDPHLLGYDLMNEPAPGSLWPTCTSATSPVARCAESDRTWLAPFHQRVANAIREADPSGIVWYEPWGQFAFGASTFHPPLKDPAPPTGFSFHVYCLLGGAGPFAQGNSEYCRSRDAQALQNADSQPDPNAARLLSEFGATTDNDEIERLVDAADAHAFSWQYWMYCNFCQTLQEPPEGQTAAEDSVIVEDARRPLEGDNVDEGKLDVLGRAYPEVISGTPESYEFDDETRVFEFRYSTARADGDGAFPPGSLTEVFVPDRHYPQGYRVSVEGATALRKSDPQRLYLRSSRGSEEVSLRIEPNADRQGG